MVRSMVGVVVVGSCISCTAYQRPPREPLTPVPLPAFAQGQVREIAVSPYLGNREIGQCLAQAVGEWHDRRVAVIRMVNAQSPGAVLAWAAVNWAQLDGPNAWLVEDCRRVLAGCLGGVKNWTTPQIVVSTDAKADAVYACAAFTPGPDRPQPMPTCTLALRTPAGVPLFFVHVTAESPDNEWIGQTGLARYVVETGPKRVVPVASQPRH